MRRIGHAVAILAFVLAVSGKVVQGGLVWVDPNDFSEGQQITVPFVTLSAILGNTNQNPPDGRVLALPDNKNQYPGKLFFGWHIKPPVDEDYVPWRAKWANFQATFDDPVSYVSLDFYRNDFGNSGGVVDEIGFILAFDELNNLIWNEWVYLSGDQYWATVEISLLEPKIKKIVAGGVYVRSTCNPGIDHDILITRLGYSVEPIPEPGSAILLLSGGVIAGAIARFRRNKRST